MYARQKSWEREHVEKLPLPQRVQTTYEFIDAIFRYLDVLTYPGADIDWAYNSWDAASADPDLVRKLDEDARRTAIDYHRNKDTKKTAINLLRYGSDFAGLSGDKFSDFYRAYQPNPYSHLPVLLATELGMLPETLTESREDPYTGQLIGAYRLYSNEFKALLDTKLNLCKKIDSTTYLASLISSADLHGQEDEYENNIYTSDDILRLLLQFKECPQTYKAVQEYLDLVNQKITGLINNPSNDEEQDRKTLRLLTNIRSGFEEYIRKRNLTPGVFERAQAQAKKIVGKGKAKSTESLVKLRDDAMGRNGLGGLKEAKDISWEKLMGIANESGLSPYKMRYELMKVVGDKVDAIQKKVTSASSAKKAIDAAKDLGIGKVSTQNDAIQYVKAIQNSLGQASWENLIGLGNKFGLLKVPETRIAFRDWLISQA